MSKYKLDIFINVFVLLICISAIIFIANWPTGAFVAPFFYIWFVMGPMTVVQLISFWLSIKKVRTKINWTISIPIIIFILTVLFTIKFATDCPYYKV